MQGPRSPVLPYPLYVQRSEHDGPAGVRVVEWHSGEALEGASVELVDRDNVMVASSGLDGWALFPSAPSEGARYDIHVRHPACAARSYLGLRLQRAVVGLFCELGTETSVLGRVEGLIEPLGLSALDGQFSVVVRDARLNRYFTARTRSGKYLVETVPGRQVSLEVAAIRGELTDPYSTIEDSVIAWGIVSVAVWPPKQPVAVQLNRVVDGAIEVRVPWNELDVARYDYFVSVAVRTPDSWFGVIARPLLPNDDVVSLRTVRPTVLADGARFEVRVGAESRGEPFSSVGVAQQVEAGQFVGRALLGPREVGWRGDVIEVERRDGRVAASNVNCSAGLESWTGVVLDERTRIEIPSSIPGPISRDCLLEDFVFAEPVSFDVSDEVLVLSRQWFNGTP